MATTPTNKPIPSEDPRDLKFNAGKIDEEVNGSADYYTDRFDAQRMTNTGRNNAFNAQLTQQRTDFETSQAARDAVVEETRQNLIPLSRQYMTLAAAQEDIANIPSGSTTYVRSQDGSSLADEYINNGGTLTATGRKMPSQQSIDEISAVTARVLFDGRSDTYWNIVDSEGNVGARFRNNDSGELEYNSPQTLLSSSGFGGDDYQIETTNLFSFVIHDEDGNVCYLITNSGRTNAQGNRPTRNVEDVVTSMVCRSATQLAANSVYRTINTQKPTKKLNLFLSGGQSYSVHADSERVLTTTQYDGNLMLGTVIEGLAAPWASTFTPEGGAILSPLVSKNSEALMVSAINELKRLRNEQNGVDSDLNHLYGTSETGIGSRDIQTFIDGEGWTRLTTCIDGWVTAAAAAGYELNICGYVYLQGENDNTKTYDYYYGKLRELFQKITAMVKEKIPGNKDFPFFLTSIGGYFAPADNLNQISRAQMDYCRNNANVHMVGPYQALPCPQNGIHLLSNSYRWLGAQIAKVMHSVISGHGRTVFGIREVKHSGNTLWVGMDVPVPPLVFRTAYIENVATDFVDRGFTVLDDSGSMIGDELSVEIVQPTVIKITCSRDLVGTVRLTLGDKTNHSGRHNVADSDPSISKYVWEINPDTTASDYIPALNDKNYRLVNWANLDSVLSEKF